MDSLTDLGLVTVRKNSSHGKLTGYVFEPKDIARKIASFYMVDLDHIKLSWVFTSDVEFNLYNQKLFRFRKASYGTSAGQFSFT